MTSLIPLWLSEDEVLFHRMESFHRRRLEEIAAGNSPLGKRETGLLVAHLIPVATVRERLRFDGSKLNSAASTVSAFGSSGRHSRLNVDGVLIFDGYELFKSYTQVFRDGKMEAVMSDISYELRPQYQDSSATPQKKGPRGLRDSACEQAIITAVSEYQRLCKALEMSMPFFLFSTVIGCETVRIVTDHSFHDLSRGAIDRSPMFLPDVEIDALEAEPSVVLRPWCDTLWQCCGLEKSLNFDEKGKWRERER